MAFFGIDFKTKTTQGDKKGSLKTFEVEAEGGVEQRINYNGNTSYAYDLATVPTDEIELIMKYREMSKIAEIDLAIQHIKNEMFVFDVPGKKPVNITFLSQGDNLSEQLKEKILAEFSNIYNILDFQNKGLEYFLSWYIDGKLYLHKVVDNDNLKKGIERFIKIEPTNIKKIKEYTTESLVERLFDVRKIKEYYMYVENSSYFKNKSGQTNYSFNTASSQALKITSNSVVYIDSGLYDDRSGNALSYLHKSILPYNNLKLLEDASIIYRVTRAPSRRIFYIDTGNLPAPKSEAKVKQMMEQFRTKIAYDPKTGTIADRRNILSMVEDYWFPRQGEKNTEVQELSAGDDQSTELLDYHRNKLYNSLNVPYSRLTTEASFNFGKSSEIERTEYMFKKFIDSLRQRFMFIFEDSLRTQLILKKIISEDEWEDVKRCIQWVYAEDNNFVEWKESEILASRVELLNNVKDLVEDGYFSKKWIQKNVLKFTDEEIEQINKENNEESEPVETPQDETNDEDKIGQEGEDSDTSVEFNDYDEEWDFNDTRILLDS